MSNHQSDKAVLNAIFNPLLPAGGEVPDDVEEEVDQGSVSLTEADKQAKELELNGVKSAEAGDTDAALDYFSQAVQVAPANPSCYNNRAQALRLKGDVQGALEDLNTAIRLSQGRGKAACQAYTQRGLIHRLEGHDEEALEDFKKAGNLGSEFAKTQVVRMNPYAAMCNKMLNDVISKIRAGECTD